jgi:Family of unknown function (DUF6455)
MARVNWSRFQQILRRHALMDYMMDKCGVDPVKVVRAGDAFADARAKCANCPHDDGCHNWIVQGGGVEPPDFCANAELFRACKREES